jgi:hypothetical protein
MGGIGFPLAMQNTLNGVLPIVPRTEFGIGAILQDPDIHRAARHLIDNYGSSATTVAERRAINMEQSGSDSAAKTWHLIARIVRQIQTGRDEPFTEASRPRSSNITVDARGHREHRLLLGERLNGQSGTKGSLRPDEDHL